VQAVAEDLVCVGLVERARRVGLRCGEPVDLIRASCGRYCGQTSSPGERRKLAPPEPACVSCAASYRRASLQC
jgi:DNA-binding IclR family transcriptional regulator